MGMHGKYVGVLLVSVGCTLDPKTVGMGTDTDTEDGSGSASEASDTDEGSASASQSSSVSVSDSATMTSDSGSSDETGCVDDNCLWDPCGDLVCGAYCEYCPPWDENCPAPGTQTVCTAVGNCEPWPSLDEDPCPGQGLEQGFELDLGAGGGCSDMYIHAGNADETQALFVVAEGVVAMAEAAGETITVEYAGDDPALQISATFGMHLLSAACNDLVVEVPVIEELWHAGSLEGGEAGTVTIEVNPEGEGTALATVTLDGVVLVRDTDAFDVAIVIDHVVFTDVLVGWLPG